jgi:hypothetical protein
MHADGSDAAIAASRSDGAVLAPASAAAARRRRLGVSLPARIALGHEPRRDLGPKRHLVARKVVRLALRLLHRAFGCGCCIARAARADIVLPSRRYAHAMYQKPGLRTNVYESGWLAVSDDGAHWQDGGPVAPEHPHDMWWKGFVRQIRGDAANTTDDALFIMDHGVADPSNDHLRFLVSSDLKNWVENSTSAPDPRWYNTHGRWDHMYMSADHENGGYIGFAVSSPTVEPWSAAGTWPGINRSPDGITWTQHPPLNVSWNGVYPTGIEEGGFERVKGLDGSDRFHLIGGGGGPKGVRDAYSMWVWSSDKIDGPYSPVVDGFRLSGGVSHSPRATRARGPHARTDATPFHPLHAAQGLRAGFLALTHR